MSSNKRAAMIETSMKQGKSVLPDDQVRQNMNSGPAMSSGKSKAPDIIMNRESSVAATCKYANESQTFAPYGYNKGYHKIQPGSGTEIQDGKSSVVFKRKLFQFSSSFPEERVSCSIFFFVNCYKLSSLL